MSLPDRFLNVVFVRDDVQKIMQSRVGVGKSTPNKLIGISLLHPVPQGFAKIKTLTY